jgi:hypothetical protein
MMLSGTGILRLLPLLSMLALTGCKGPYQFSNVTPDPTQTHYIDLDEDIAFSVTTTPANSDLLWCYRKHEIGQPADVFAARFCETRGTATNYTYKPQIDDNLYDYIDVQVNLQTLEHGISIEPPMPYDYWKTRITNHWKIAVQPSQTPPVWKGSVHLQHANDLAKLAGFTEITGQLIIENCDFPPSAALGNLKRVGGNLSIINCPVLTHPADLGLHPALIFGGDITIENNANLESLAGLSSEQSINSLAIRNNPKLINLTALQDIAHIATRLQISDNASLTDLSGLQNIAEVGQAVTITNNLRLKTLTGLDQLESTALMIVADNAALERLQGLGNLSQVSSSLMIYYNPSLPSLAGLDSLQSAGSLTLYSNAALRSLEGMEQLHTVEKLDIAGNPLLTSLAGLNQVQSLAEGWIINNATLQSVTGLDSLTAAGDLRVQSNPALTSLEGLRSLENSTTLIIHDNKALTTLEGLNALTSTQWLQISNNTTLDSITALANLTEADMLEIYDNPALCQQQTDALVDQIQSVSGPLDYLNIDANKFCAP